MKKLIASLLVAVACGGWTHGHYTGPTGSSQFNPDFFGTGEFIFLNRMKETFPMSYGANRIVPTDVDSLGNPVFGGPGFASGYSSFAPVPTQWERPGHYVLTATGVGKFEVSENAGAAASNVTASSCNGSTAGGGTTWARCDTATSPCATVTGYIVGTTLTIVTNTNTGVCVFVAGQPISATGMTVNKFGVPTIITSLNGNSGNCTSCTYTVNWSQTTGSVGTPATITPGYRFEVAFSNQGINISPNTGGIETDIMSDTFKILASGTSQANTLQNLGYYHINDEAAYASGQIVSQLYKQRVQQANFAVMRDLNLAFANNASCTTWDTRKPAAYRTWRATEARNAISGQGVYVNAAGTGASGGTITYDAGADNFNITVGSGNWTDKQMIIATYPASGTVNSTVSLNGNTPVKMLNQLNNSISFKAPVSGVLAPLVYDAAIGAAYNFDTNNLGGVTNGIDCGIPPEAFIELAHELGVNPYVVEPFLAADPMTDYMYEYAKYIKANFPLMVPQFETPNETWNCLSGPGNYGSTKSRAWGAVDGAWLVGANQFCGSAGNLANWIGKVGSVLCQTIYNIYGGDTSRYRCNAGVQVVNGNGNTAPSNNRLVSAAYVAQSTANIPLQTNYIGGSAAATNFTQSAAYNWVTNIAIANYYNPIQTSGGYQNLLTWGYNYYNGVSPDTQVANFNATFLLPFASNNFGIPAILLYAQGWQTWVANCGGAGAVCSVGLTNYEGGQSTHLWDLDTRITFAITSATNGSPCQLNSVALNGAVAGMSVQITAATGGTWSTVVGNTYTVQASGLTTTVIPINLDCTSLGTLSSATLIFPNSTNYINALILGSFQSAQTATNVLTQYANMVSTGVNNPSQFNLYQQITFLNEWGVWLNDMYGYMTMATCTACTISGTTLTLGGTVSGVFAAGQTLFGRGVPGSGPGSNTTITGGCSTAGPLPCGANSGDTLTISGSVTVSSGTPMSGNFTPVADNAGTTNGICKNVTPSTDQIACSFASPIAAWQGIRAWNNSLNN